MNIKVILAVFALVLTNVLLTQCKATKGFGRDLQHLGERIETKAEEKRTY